MDLLGRLQLFLDSHDSVITTSEAARLGITGNGLRAFVRRETLRRAVHGGYVCASTEARLNPAGRHLLALRALLRTRPDALAASHVSAAVVHRLPVLDRDLDRLHVTQRRQTKETARYDTHTVHRSPPPGGLHEGGRLPVVRPVLAVLGTTILSGPASGIMAADAALRAGLTTKSELARWLERLRHHPGVSMARLVVERASPTAESAGESLSRLVLEDLGYRVIPQVTIVERDGRFVARVDFLIPELGVVVEFDGMVKYAGADGPSALAAEKQREDALRRLGYGVVRLVWADLFQPARVRAAIQQAALTASPRRIAELTGRKVDSTPDASHVPNVSSL